MRLIEKVWFDNHQAKWLLVPLLLPFTALFWLLTVLRRVAFYFKIIKSYKISYPVIVVGNISVGGNGKTPIVIHLVKLAQKMGFTPGVISRGYGGDITVIHTDNCYPYLLNSENRAIEVGDEPLLIFKRCHIPVVVGSDRVSSAKLLVEQGCNLIISDDGLQHYKLKRDVEIIVVDSNRLHGNNLLLPAGPLREGKWRLPHADFIIYNNNAICKSDINTNTKKKSILTSSTHDLSMSLTAQSVCNILTGECVVLKVFLEKNKVVNAIAGIGSPQRFFSTLSAEKFILNRQQSFVDHYHYQLTDLSTFDDNIPLLMTEKDAVKCHAFAKEHWWYVPVDALFSSDDNLQLIDKLQQLKSEYNI